MIRIGTQRFYVLVWARRSGKNFISMLALIQTAMENPGTRSLFIGKNNRSARVTAFEVVKDMLYEQIGQEAYSANASTLEIRLLDEQSVISFGSSETPDSFRGQEVDGICVLDEIDFWGSASGQSNFPEMFESVIMPLTARTQAKILVTSTPKGVGMPLHKMWKEAQLNPDVFYSSHVTAVQAGIISHDEIALAKGRVSDRAFREEYEAEFCSASSRVYPHFGKKNVVDTIKDRGVELYVGLDHNVAVSTAIIGQRGDTKDSVEIFNEIVLKNSNTRKMAIAIASAYPDRNITVYPDPSGKARKTSAEIGVTDHSMLKEEGLKVSAPNKAPLIVDRLNNANNIILSADGTVRMIVAKKCTNFIEAREMHLYDEKKGQPIKGGTDHYDDTNDSGDYLFWGLYGEELLNKAPLKVVKDLNFYG